MEKKQENQKVQTKEISITVSSATERISVETLLSIGKESLVTISIVTEKLPHL
jgi:hypothetical protein